MERKDHRKKLRKITDILTKKFIDVSIETPRQFEDKKDFVSLDLFFYYDKEKLKLDYIKKEIYNLNMFKNVTIDEENKISIEAEIDNETILVNISFYNSFNLYKFNILINSFFPFKLILGLLSSEYECSIKEIGLTKKKQTDGKEIDILVTDDFDVLMELFGMDINAFQKSFTKEQFFGYLLTMQSICLSPFFNMDDEDLDGFVKYIKNKTSNIPFRQNYHINKKIDLLTNPKEVCKRTIDKMEFNKKDIYEELMFLYVNRDKELSFKNLDRKVFFYINNLLEAFNLKFIENGFLSIDDAIITLYNKKVSKLSVLPYLFKIDINGKEIIYGFELIYNSMFNKLKFNVNVNVEIDDKIANIVNKLSNYLMEEFKFSYTFVLNNIDIKANFNSKLDELKELKVKN